MKGKTIWLLMLLCLFSIQLIADSLRALEDSITVYIFLHESCVISQYYTLPLQELHQAYAHEYVQVIGLFPNASSSLVNIQALCQEESGEDFGGPKYAFTR